MEHINDLLSKATYYHQTLNFREAESYYLKLIELQPNNDRVFYTLGVLYSQSEKYDLSLKLIKNAIDINPNNPIYHITLGEVMLKTTSVNLEQISQDIILNPESSDLYFNLGNVYRKNNNYKEAIENYEKAISLNPNNQRAYNSLGNIYLEYTDYTKAKTVFRKLSQLNPNFPQLSQKIDSIMQIEFNLKKKIKNLSSESTFGDINEKYDDDDLIYNYITLLKKNLTNSLRLDIGSFDYKIIQEGLNWPLNSETMIGIKRLNNLHYCITETIKNNIDGDLIETGVWKGGATILMNALLKSYKINNKKVWVADSFEGLPPPDEKYIEDNNSIFHLSDVLRISLEQVKNNFIKYNLLDDNVVFLKGWFKDTLPKASISKLSILRLDGDMYQSTIESLENLYPKLSIGGYIIIDDYNAISACRDAVNHYRDKNNITEQIRLIDYSGVYWKKEI